MREYIRTGQPVGSKALVDQFNLGISSATVRNEMGALEQRGLIYAPHTSAGRVPTEQGYRYFVQPSAAERRRSPARSAARSPRNSATPPTDLDDWPRIAAMVLARTAQTAALVTPPRAVENHFKHLELIKTQGRHGAAGPGPARRQRPPADAHPGRVRVPQDVLSHTAQIINLHCVMLTAEQVRARTRSQSDELTREIGELVADAMRQTNQQTSRDVYRYGLSESLSTFTDNEAQQAIRVLEEDELLDGILREMLDPDQPDLQIVVAGEGRWESLSHLSIVLGRYGTPNTRGALGVLGPTRMRYGHAVSAVRYVAHLMTGLLGEMYGDKENKEGE